MAAIDSQLLCNRWLHSYEEDTADQTVFRPASFRFPPARGRDGFELRPDQSMVELRIGPTDRIEEVPGKWTLDGESRLLFYTQSSPNPARVMQIISADQDRLIIKK